MPSFVVRYKNSVSSIRLFEVGTVFVSKQYSLEMPVIVRILRVVVSKDYSQAQSIILNPIPHEDLDHLRTYEQYII